MTGERRVVATAYMYRGVIIYRIDSGMAVIFVEPDRPVYFLDTAEAEWFVTAKDRYIAQVETLISTGSTGGLLVPSVTG